MREDSLDLWAMQLHASLVGYNSELCFLSLMCMCGCTLQSVYSFKG